MGRHNESRGHPWDVGPWDQQWRSPQFLAWTSGVPLALPVSRELRPCRLLRTGTQVFRLRGHWDWRSHCPGGWGELRAAWLTANAAREGHAPLGTSHRAIPLRRERPLPFCSLPSGCWPWEHPQQTSCTQSPPQWTRFGCSASCSACLLAFAGIGTGSRWGVIGIIRALTLLLHPYQTLFWLFYLITSSLNLLFTYVCKHVKKRMLTAII